MSLLENSYIHIADKEYKIDAAAISNKTYYLVLRYIVIILYSLSAVFGTTIIYKYSLSEETLLNLAYTISFIYVIMEIIVKFYLQYKLTKNLWNTKNDIEYKISHSKASICTKFLLFITLNDLEPVIGDVVPQLQDLDIIDAKNKN